METRMWDGLVGVTKEAYTASLGEGVAPRPLLMPLVRGELVWVRPLKVGQDPLARIAELANIAAAARVDKVVPPDWRPALLPQRGCELVPPIQAAVNFSFTPIELDRPDPFGVTVVLMEEDDYRISLTEAFSR